MKVRLYNNDETDFIDYEADTIEEIQEQAKSRLTLLSWKDGRSVKLEE